MPNVKRLIILFPLLGSLTLTWCALQKAGRHGELTGEILPVFYVKDVRRSVAFYTEKLGFDFHHFWDYEINEEVRIWTAEEPPTYAEMGAGSLKFGLHLGTKQQELQAGGTIHYFRVKDVTAHHIWVRNRGIEPGNIVERPWMTMFSVVDPDGHRIYFFTPPEMIINNE